MAYLGFSSERGHIERRFLLDAIGYVRDVLEGTGWDNEFPRDVWLLRRLGYPGRDARFRFTGIEPLWLRELTKRWVRWRRSTGIALATVGADIRAITQFSQSFPALRRGPQALDRALIKTYLAHLAERFPTRRARPGRSPASPGYCAPPGNTAGSRDFPLGLRSTRRTTHA